MTTTLPVILTIIALMNTMVLSFPFHLAANLRRDCYREHYSYPQVMGDAVMPTRIHVLSFLLGTLSAHDQNDDRNDDLSSNDEEYQIDFDMNNKNDFTSSILPPPPKEASHRFPFRKRGFRTRIRRTVARPQSEGEHYKSILPPLPPPPTSNSEKFPDRQTRRVSGGDNGRENKKLSWGNDFTDLRTPGRGEDK